MHFLEPKKITKLIKLETSYLDIADGYLFASPFMIDLLSKNKPIVVSYGSYKVASSIKKNNSNKIHIVYSGVIENLRKAAFLVANSALFLSNDYVIHIAGYGTNENVKEFKDVCVRINEKLGYEAVMFHGLLIGKEFDNLLNSCDISINAHMYSEEDLWKSKYSFPSKIPLNMGYDLYLVSHNMELVSSSPFAEFTSFFSEFNPQAVAEAIKKCAIKSKLINSNRTPKDLIRDLDVAFVKNIKSLFDSI